MKSNGCSQRFFNISISTLYEHAPCKKKYARANHMPCLTKDLLKVIMAKSRLRNNFLKIKTGEENRTLYVKQQNYCISLLSEPKA